MSHCTACGYREGHAPECQRQWIGRPTPQPSTPSPTIEERLCGDCGHSEGEHRLDHTACHGTYKSGKCDCTGYYPRGRADSPSPPDGWIDPANGDGYAPDQQDEIEEKKRALEHYLSPDFTKPRRRADSPSPEGARTDDHDPDYPGHDPDCPMHSPEGAEPRKRPATAVERMRRNISRIDSDYSLTGYLKERFREDVAAIEREAALPEPSLDVASFLESLRSPRNSLGKLALPKGPMEWAVQEAWESAQEWVGDPDDGITATHMDILADSIIDRLVARLGTGETE